MASIIDSKKNLFDLLHSNRKIIRSFGVDKLGVFGSFISGKINEDSDVDLLIEFNPSKKNYDNFIELSFFLEELLSRKVELVTPQSLSKHIGPYILEQTEYVSI
jgi:hypothetical protein